MHIRLSDHFSYAKLLRFTFPTIVMLIFTSIYGVVDGVFVSNYAGKTAFAAVNLIMPALMIFATVGFMLGTGGSAVVARTMGEGDLPRANRYFSLIVAAGVLAGAVLTVLAELIMEPLCLLLGAAGEMLPLAVRYGRILSLALVPFILQNMFQSFLVAAERPKLGLWLTVAAGLTNMVGDWLLVGGPALGRGRGGHRHGGQLPGGGRSAPGLLPPAQQDPSPPDKNQTGGPGPGPDLLQRLLGDDGKPLHLPGQHPL
jgi:Na+-driven multidrug efflux pump